MSLDQAPVSGADKRETDDAGVAPWSCRRTPLLPLFNLLPLTSLLVRFIHIRDAATIAQAREAGMEDMRVRSLCSGHHTLLRGWLLTLKTPCSRYSMRLPGSDIAKRCLAKVPLTEKFCPKHACPTCGTGMKSSKAAGCDACVNDAGELLYEPLRIHTGSAGAASARSEGPSKFAMAAQSGRTWTSPRWTIEANDEAVVPQSIVYNAGGGPSTLGKDNSASAAVVYSQATPRELRDNRGSTPPIVRFSTDGVYSQPDDAYDTVKSL